MSIVCEAVDNRNFGACHISLWKLTSHANIVVLGEKSILNKQNSGLSFLMNPKAIGYDEKNGSIYKKKLRFFQQLQFRNFVRKKSYKRT